MMNRWNTAILIRRRSRTTELSFSWCWCTCRYMFQWKGLCQVRLLYISYIEQMSYILQQAVLQKIVSVLMGIFPVNSSHYTNQNVREYSELFQCNWEHNRIIVATNCETLANANYWRNSSRYEHSIVERSSQIWKMNKITELLREVVHEFPKSFPDIQFLAALTVVVYIYHTLRCLTFADKIRDQHFLNKMSICLCTSCKGRPEGRVW